MLYSRTRLFENVFNRKTFPKQQKITHLVFTYKYYYQGENLFVSICDDKRQLLCPLQPYSRFDIVRPIVRTTGNFKTTQNEKDQWSFGSLLR